MLVYDDFTVPQNLHFIMKSEDKVDGSGQSLPYFAFIIILFTYMYFLCYHVVFMVELFYFYFCHEPHFRIIIVGMIFNIEFGVMITFMYVCM